jgi:hypothetical protein
MRVDVNAMKRAAWTRLGACGVFSASEVAQKGLSGL